MDHLYIMQNQLGLIKVGRSINPTVRKKALESADRCQIKIVAILKNEGVREEQILRLMRRFKLFGEWFDGCKSARDQLIFALGLPKDTAWPYELSESTVIETWEAETEPSRRFVSNQSQLQRLIRDMKRTPGPDQTTDWLNGKIWQLLHRLEHDEEAIYFVESGSNGAELVSYKNKDRYVLPSFTTVIEDALSLWPGDEKPSNWRGSTWECCITGLIARKKRIIANFKANKDKL